jgi:hypothetical protein
MIAVFAVPIKMYIVILLLTSAFGFEYLTEFSEVRKPWHPHLSFA